MRSLYASRILPWVIDREMLDDTMSEKTFGLVDTVPALGKDEWEVCLGGRPRAPPDTPIYVGGLPTPHTPA